MKTSQKLRTHGIYGLVRVNQLIHWAKYTWLVQPLLIIIEYTIAVCCRLKSTHCDIHLIKLFYIMIEGKNFYKINIVVLKTLFKIKNK